MSVCKIYVHVHCAKMCRCFGLESILICVTAVVEFMTFYCVYNSKRSKNCVYMSVSACMHVLVGSCNPSFIGSYGKGLGHKVHVGHSARSATINVCVCECM